MLSEFLLPDRDELLDVLICEIDGDILGISDLAAKKGNLAGRDWELR